MMLMTAWIVIRWRFAAIYPLTLPYLTLPYLTLPYLTLLYVRIKHIRAEMLNSNSFRLRQLSSVISRHDSNIC